MSRNDLFDKLHNIDLFLAKVEENEPYTENELNEARKNITLIQGDISVMSKELFVYMNGVDSQY